MPQLATVSYALFDGATVLTCTEKTGPAEKIAAFVVPPPNVKLNQTCDSLGRVALTVCEMEHGTIKYYANKYSDKYMAGCVKDGGKWTTNNSLEAQTARAEQDLEAAKAAAGIH